MKAKGFSFKGVRENNEDSFLVMEAENGVVKTTFYNDGNLSDYEDETECPDFSLYAVSDGMGGLEYGAEASFLTLSKLQDCVEDIVLSDDRKEAVVKSVKDISEKLESNFSGKAGATLVGILTTDDGNYMFNTGDSLCFVMSENGMLKNKRHTCLNEAMEKGVECEPGMEDYVTDSIGMINPRVDVCEIGEFESALLCSDGLLPYLEEGSVGEAVDLGPEAVCRKAMELGSSDNVTAVVVERDSAA